MPAHLALLIVAIVAAIEADRSTSLLTRRRWAVEDRWVLDGINPRIRVVDLRQQQASVTSSSIKKQSNNSRDYY